MTESVFTKGEKFRGYVIERLLGRGGLGEVYLARHELLDQDFAVKILLPCVAESNPEFVKRFLREARIAARIRQPNLVQVHDVGYDKAKDVHYLVMDYVEGASLRTEIAMGGAMEPKEAVRIVSSVAQALAAGESLGVIHRDIKPENIIITTSRHVKLVDLGVAKMPGTDSLMTMAKTVFGTPTYMSPEQALDSSQVDFRADVYSLGIVLFELLAGKPPYACANISDALRILTSPDPLPDVRTVSPDVPAGLAELVGRMCDKDLGKRVASASAVLKEMRKLGYDVPASGSGEAYAANAASGESFSFSGLVGAEANDTLSFETQDEEIKAFVAKLKAKKRSRRMMAAGVALAIIATLVLAALYCLF